MSAYLLPVVLLIASNVFMTVAWYGHLKYSTAPLWAVVIISWSIAFIEYWMAVPANRIGHQVYSTAQLKTIQEVITLVVFVGFSTFYLKEPPSLTTVAGFVLIGLGAMLVFKG
ncbi:MULTISPECIES: DMT family protein [Thioclava]|uniref:DMT family protein n=1 Tax=Thioclava litoralis TaxID=3076557 RepID=A0ABZ1DX40_9RHOB|nr:DMT family protein [Thioclava sp. FTW29]